MTVSDSRRLPDLRLRSRFVVAGASVVGPAHHSVGRNNQDAWAASLGDDFAVLAVADGCSGGMASEVGAHFAARWVVAQAVRRWTRERTGHHDDLAHDLFDGLTARLGELAAELAFEPHKSGDVVGDLLLATLLVAFVDHEVASVFVLGDGLVVVDGAAIPIASDGKLGPDYLAYRLLPREDTGRDPASISPRRLSTTSTAVLQSLVLATDGAHDMLPGVAGRDRLAPLFEDGQIARRPALLEARLGGLASEPGLLHDDVTILTLIGR